jgi:cysteinyl-tRNA synthetase
MSKSIGNVLTLPDIVAKNFSPLDLRYYLLSVHYRTNLKFTWKGIEDAKKARKKIVDWMEELQTASPQKGSKASKNEFIDYFEKFTSAMNSDLNTSAALAAIFDAMNAYHASTSLDAASLDHFRAFAENIRMTFGCFEPEVLVIPDDVQALVDERAAARTAKDFAESDRLRDAIAAKGFLVKDTPQGQTVKRA